MSSIDLIPNAALIGGEWIVDEQRLEVLDPATGRSVGHVPVLGAEAAQAAIDAAHTALAGWRARTAGERADILLRFFALMGEHREELANILTSEQGKPLAEARAEIDYAASFIRWFAEEGRRAYGEVIPPHQSSKRIIVLKQAVGVVAAITPWNFPAAMVTRKIAPALAAGCTVVVKPAEQTPMTAIALSALALAAGVPPGVFNVVTGPAVAIGRVLTGSPVVKKLSFTGSTAVGELLYAACASSIKKLSLELGGNAPFLVFDDADLDAAVDGAIQSKFRNAGQTCVCANRFLVQAGIYDRFVAKFTARAAALRVAPGSDPTADIGPLIDEDAVLKVEAHIADALALGARLETGGARHNAGGQFFEPTVVSNVPAEAQVMNEETFGPVAAIAMFADEEEALATANATSAGLAAYFYTRDFDRVWRIAEGLEVGMVGINTGLISTEVAPFGGVKTSGLGREGSRHGLDDYLELKTLCMDVGS